MENWRKFVAEEEQTEFKELEEGFIGKAIGGLAIVAAGFLGSPAEAAENDVIVAVPQSAINLDAGPELKDGGALKLQSAFQTSFFKHLKGSGLKAHDRETSAKVIRDATGGEIPDANSLADFAEKVNSNMVGIQYDRTKEGMDTIISVYDHNGDLIEKEVLQIPNDETSWEVIDAKVKQMSDSIISTLASHPSPSPSAGFAAKADAATTAAHAAATTAATQQN